MEIVVRAPEDQVVVQLLAEADDGGDDGGGGAAAPAVVIGGDGTIGASGERSDGASKLSQRLRLPHYDKRFCCNREV